MGDERHQGLPKLGEQALNVMKILDGIFAHLGPEPVPSEVLRRALHLDQEVFEKALEKLWIHGGALVDFAENVSRGEEGWRELYIAQGEHKVAQLDGVIHFAQSHQCRMACLVRHFGDHGDTRQSCGVCDVCDPDGCIAQSFRPADATEQRICLAVLDDLRKSGVKSAGRLHSDQPAVAAADRKVFEGVLAAMAGAGLVEATDATFEKDGKQIAFTRVSLTEEGRAADESVAEGLSVRVEIERVKRARKAKAKKRTKAEKKPKAAVRAESPEPESPEPESPEVVGRLEEKLRGWRMNEARRRSVPAFRIMTDKVLKAIAAARPATTQELLSIPGIGLSFVEKHGASIFALVERELS
jgi:superfamily II DNA helicase RecQ